MLTDYFTIALRSLLKRRLRTYLTMIGIFIGIAAVVSLIGLGEGLRIAITSQFGFLGTDVLSVQAANVNFAGAPGQGAPNPLKEDLVDQIRKINNVEAAFGRYIGSATIEFRDKQKIEFVMSVPDKEDRKIFERMMNLKVQDGRLLTDQDARGVLLGSNYHTGITYGATFDRPINAGDKVLINNKEFTVVGILENKGSFIFDDAIMMNNDAMIAEGIKADDGTVNIIGVKVKDVNQMEQTQQDIEKLLRKERDVKVGEEDFVVETPQKALESLNSTLFAVQLFVTIIAVISLVVGGIGIMNTMYTAVLERTKEIGIMKSIGAKNSTIFTLFFIESGMLGMVGGLIGILLGMGFAYGLAYVASLALGSDLIRASISIGLILGALAFSFFFGTVFGVLPAIRASKLNPVDSLRGAK
ncbi:MAG TPA: ABC transporter permease [Candidatus Nanoarchaeia archaeon]|nr:ABC transporter permease [Candidatus Nanoarchaeia archaeon]